MLQEPRLCVRPFSVHEMELNISAYERNSSMTAERQKFNTWLKNIFQTFFFFFHDKIWPVAGPAGPTMSPTLYHLWTLPAREWLSV